MSLHPDTALITGVVASASGAHGDKVRGGLTLTCTFPSPDLAASEPLVWAPVWPPAWARRDPAARVVSLARLRELREQAQRAGRVFVWTSGCFDLLHAGHLESLLGAARLGHFLAVGLNSDASVRALKGPSRPALPEGERALLLAALPCVDAVLVFDDLTPLAALEVLRPDVLCRGTDQAPPGGPDPEGALVAGYGGRVVFVPHSEEFPDRELLRRLNQPTAG